MLQMAAFGKIKLAAMNTALITGTMLKTTKIENISIQV